MIPFAVLLLQAQTVPLTPFFDDGGTTTHDSPPAMLPLVRGGGRQTATIRAGKASYQVWVVPPSANPTMFVDFNQNGKPDANERVKLSRKDAKLPDGSNLAAYQGEFSLPLPGGGKAKYVTRFLLSSTKDPGFREVKDRLVVMSQFGYLGKAKFGGKQYRIGIRGGNSEDAALFIDRDGDGVLGSQSAEMYRLKAPFKIDGKTYQMTSFQPGARASVSFGPSSQRVAEQMMPPDLREGKIVPGWSGPTLSGKTVNFPGSFRGKLVLLDVWATWCGPCRGEIPYMKAAYAKYRKRGFEIVSYSIDDPNFKSQVAAFVKEAGTNWTQVYEGKGRESYVNVRYAIEAIPFMLLVDGSTGKILATEQNLRGPNLDPTIEGMLTMRGR